MGVAGMAMVYDRPEVKAMLETGGDPGHEPAQRGLGCGWWRGILRSCSGGGGTIGIWADGFSRLLYNRLAD
jgi:hypothetical protein